MKELQLSVLRKEYVKREDVSRQWAEQAGRVRQKLLSLPVKTAGMISGQALMPDEAEGILQKAVNEALQELAEDYTEE